MRRSIKNTTRLVKKEDRLSFVNQLKVNWTNEVQSEVQAEILLTISELKKAWNLN